MIPVLEFQVERTSEEGRRGRERWKQDKTTNYEAKRNLFEEAVLLHKISGLMALQR